MESKNIMIVGVGGQGTLLTSRILGGLTIAGGYDVKLSEVHGVAQRGGSVVTFVRYGDKVAEPIVEEGQADVIIAFERLEALRSHACSNRSGRVSGTYPGGSGKRIQSIPRRCYRGVKKTGQSESIQFDCTGCCGAAYGFYKRTVV